MRKPLSDPEDIIDNLMSLIKGQISDSLTKKNKGKLQLLAATTASIEVFTFQVRDDEKLIHFKNISHNKTQSKMSQQEEYLTLLTISKNSLQIIVDLWDELGTVIRSLIIGSYRNVARSLRWILETLLFSILINNKKSSDIYNEINNMHTNIDKKKFKELLTFSNTESKVVFAERLKMKYEYGKPTFGSMVNDLTYFENIRELPSIREELKTLHQEFSSIVHVSVETIEQSVYHTTRADYSIFQTFEFNQEKFDLTIQKVWRVVDLVITLIIMNQAYFYQYPTPRDYVSALSNFYKKGAFGLQFIHDPEFTHNLVTMNRIIN